MSRAEWLVARKEFLVKEKEWNRQRDALSAERRKLPMVKIEKDYVFEGPNGRRTLGDVSGGRRQRTSCFPFESQDNGRSQPQWAG